MRRFCSSTEANGSSMSRISASTASARARPTRWRMPPDSSCGYLCSAPTRPTSAMYLRATSSRSSFATWRSSRPKATLRRTVAPGQQREVLEHEGALRSRSRHRLAVDQDLALGRLEQAGDDLERGRLAAAGRPEQGRQLAAREIEVDALERPEVVEHLADPAQADGRRGGRAQRDGLGPLDRSWHGYLPALSPSAADRAGRTGSRAFAAASPRRSRRR